MLLVHVQHFLSEEGRSYFPTFIKEMEKGMKKLNSGFYSIRQLIKENSSDESHFLLEYESFERLKEWAATDEHDDILDRLKKFQLQKQIVTKYFTEKD